jgi:hypothetical protein
MGDRLVFTPFMATVEIIVLMVLITVDIHCNQYHPDDNFYCRHERREYQPVSHFEKSEMKRLSRL